MAEGLADQETPAPGLEFDDALASHVVLPVEFAGAVERLQPQEANSHLHKEQDGESVQKGEVWLTFSAMAEISTFCFPFLQADGQTNL